MPIGYGYQASNDAGYVNWAEVAKGFSDMLNKENKRREDLKAEYDKQDRELANKLANSPMGQYKDGNDFIANYVEAMTKQRLIDVRLFKKGLLKEKDYILKTNNAIDGTNTLFDLQKTYQEEYKKKMDGITNNSLQAVNAFNMMTIEGFADFKNSRAVLDPATGQVKLARLKYNKETGIMEMTNDIMPVGTAMRNMKTDIPTFDVDGETTKYVNNLGALKTAVVRAATMTNAGSVTNYLNNPDVFAKTFEGGKKVIDDLNKSLNYKINEYLGIPYNMMSILTQNTGNYGADSYTYDREEAAKDPSKILVKVDDSTGLNVIDPEGPNYKKQKEEAYDWVKTDILRKIDREKTVQTAVGQLSDVTLPRTQYERGVTEQRFDAETFGKNLARLATGTPEEASIASSYLTNLKLPNYKDANGTIHFILGKKDIPYDPTKTDTNKFLEAIVAGGNEFLTANGLNQKDVVNAAKAEAKGKRYSTGAVALISAPETAGAAGYNEQALNEYLDKNIVGGGPRGVMANRTIIPNDGSKTAANLNAKFNKMNVRFESKSGGIGRSDYIKIKDAKGNDISDWINLGDQQNVSNIKDIIKANIDQSVLPSAFPVSSQQPAPSAAGGVNLNATQIKSQFGGVFQQ